MTIEEFIDNFRTSQNDYLPTEYDDSEEVIRHLFHAGYCYYFCKILETAFPGGTTCLCYPFGHFAYKCNDIYYDIEGRKDIGDVEYFIPESFIPKEYIRDFLHNGTEYNTSKEEMKKLRDDWKKHLELINKQKEAIDDFRNRHKKS